MASPQTIVVRSAGGGGGSAAGLLLLFVAIVGLLALFTGNLDRWVKAIAQPAGGPEGLVSQRGVYGVRDLVGGEWGQPVPARD